VVSCAGHSVFGIVSVFTAKALFLPSTSATISIFSSMSSRASLSPLPPSGSHRWCHALAIRFWNSLGPYHQSPLPSFDLRHYLDFLFPCLPSFLFPTKRGVSVESCAGHSVFGMASALTTKAFSFLRPQVIFLFSLSMSSRASLSHQAGRIGGVMRWPFGLWNGRRMTPPIAARHAIQRPAPPARQDAT